MEIQSRNYGIIYIEYLENMDGIAGSEENFILT